jgi:lipoprotein-anchoring transpeptidase ErfK/SrfK
MLVFTTGVWVMGVMHLTSLRTTEYDTPFKKGEVLSAQDVVAMKSVINSTNIKQYNCPFSSPVKGILDVDGKKYYLEPSNPQYLYTKPDSCFNSSEQAGSEDYISHQKNRVVSTSESTAVNPPQAENKPSADASTTSNDAEASANTIYEATSDNLTNPDVSQTQPITAENPDQLPKNLTYEQMVKRSNTHKIIVVNLAEQNLKTLDQGKIQIDTKITSGRKNFDTPTGSRTVINKGKNVRLKAPSPRFGTYDLPAKYWIGMGNGYGFHDASWRSSFGGGDYVSDGSHGCINMPLEAVKSLYDWAEVGTEVYIV